ncbi:hypothetical protein BCR44DRAFT_1427151 [Catenaria anguillulae PL171]|uniref:VASt domain-containing protein n=1 Tax=Catenaria anguillulae PL171 TaxID=765915 RepID=A0A1Y2HX44_9FUNG|nr:hypothetical protein BCR44DRAFT_1427151 [Catenaria anguillulae PL171]
MEAFPSASPSPSPSPSPPPTGTGVAGATTQPQIPAADSARDSTVTATAPPTSATTRDRSHSTPPSNLLSTLAAVMASSPSSVIPTTSPAPIPIPSPTGAASHSQSPSTTGAAATRKSRSIGNIHALHSVSENVVSVSPTNDSDPLGRRRSSIASNISSNAGVVPGQHEPTVPPPVPPIPLPTGYSTLCRAAADIAPANPEHHRARYIAAAPSVTVADTQHSMNPQTSAHDGGRNKAGEDPDDVGVSTTNIHQASSSQQEPPTHSTSGTLAKLQRRFQRHFPALSAETVISAHSCSMEKMNKEEHWVGRMYITDRHLCFQGKLDKYIAKVNVRYADVISVQSLRDGASAGSEDGGGAGPVVGVKVMSLVSKYSFSNFQNGHVPVQEIRTQWQATQSHAAALQQASQRRLDILMRPPSIVAPIEPATAPTSTQTQLPPPVNSSRPLVAPPPARPLPIPKPSPARSATTLAAPSAATATAVLVAPEPKHSAQPSSGIAVMTHPTGYNPGLSASRPSTSSGSISNTTSIPTLTGIAPIGGTPPVLNAPAAIVNGGALVVPAPSVPAPLPPVAQSTGNGSSSSMQLSAIPSMEATAGTAGTAFRGFFNRMVKSKRSESATGSGSMSTSNNAAVMAAAAAAVAAGPPASSSSSSSSSKSVTKASEKNGSRDVAPSTSSSDVALALNASATARPAAPAKPVKLWLALFGPSAPVYQSAHKTRETERMDLPEWPTPTQTTCPWLQSADSTETQKVISVSPTDGSTSPTAWIVEYSTKTPDVPSGSSFTTQARVCVNQVGPNKTSVHVQFAVNFHEKVRFIQGQIEQGGVDGCTALWKEIAQGLKTVAADAEDLESAASAPAMNMPSPLMEEPIVIEAPASEGPIASSVPGSAVGSPSKTGVAGSPATRRQPLAILHSGSVVVERLVRLYLLITAIIMTLVVSLLPTCLLLASPPSTPTPTVTSAPKARETNTPNASSVGKESSELVKGGGQKDAAAILLDTWSKSLQARAESLQAELSALRAAAAVVGGDSQKR